MSHLAKLYLLTTFLSVTTIEVHATIIESDLQPFTNDFTVIHDFEGGQFNMLGAPIDGIYEEFGTQFGERFDGQVVSENNGFEELSTTPFSELRLLANTDSNDNIGFDTNGQLHINGLNDGVLGTGALSILFSQTVNRFGFDPFNDDGGEYTIDFFDISGGLIDSVTLSSNNSFFQSFSLTNGAPLIAGVSITNTDLNGLGFGFITYNTVDAQSVAEPKSLLLILSGVISLFTLSRCRRTRASIHSIGRNK
jgi:hypothetical protein